MDSRDSRHPRMAPFTRKNMTAFGGWTMPFVAGKCPMLTASGKCSVYADRPAACRAFKCVESDYFLDKNPHMRSWLAEQGTKRFAL